MSVHGASRTTVSPDKERTPHKIMFFLQKFRSKEKKVFKNQKTQVKKQKWIVSLMKKNIIKKTPPPCKNKQDYVGGNNDKTRDDDDYPSDTDSCARNLDDEHKNEEDYEYIEPPPEENYRIKSKIC